MILLLLAALAAGHPPEEARLVRVDRASWLDRDELAIPGEALDGCGRGVGHAVLRLTTTRVAYGELSLPVRVGEVDAMVRRGRLIAPIFDRMIDDVGRMRAARTLGCPTPEQATLLVVVDAEVDQLALSQALFTAGQAGFQRFAFLVDGPGGAPRPEGPLETLTLVPGARAGAALEGLAGAGRVWFALDEEATPTAWEGEGAPTRIRLRRRLPVLLSELPELELWLP